MTDLASCRFIAEKVGVLIAGPCGTGKSHIAQALGHCAVQEGYDVAFSTHSKLLGHLHEARATGSFERRFASYARVDLLIIDDFGLDAMDAIESRDIYELLTERHRRGSIVVTSNRGPDGPSNVSAPSRQSPTGGWSAECRCRGDAR